MFDFLSLAAGDGLGDVDYEVGQFLVLGVEAAVGVAHFVAISAVLESF